MIPGIPTTPEPCGGVGSHWGGGGVTSIIKVYTDVRINGYESMIFTSKVYQWGIFFTQKYMNE